MYIYEHIYMYTYRYILMISAMLSKRIDDETSNVKDDETAWYSLALKLSRAGVKGILKLTLWVRGTNPSTLELKQARSYQSAKY